MHPGERSELSSLIERSRIPEDIELGVVVVVPPWLRRIMQAMLDRLIPVFLDYLFVDYKRWVDEYTLGVGANSILPTRAGLGSESSTSASNSAKSDCQQPLEISS